jgi:uncharacterized surface protein with fasciclin (FAS1) repeats
VGTIVDIAGSAGTFKTLVTALGAAGLAETLSGTGPFTVFAPTDEAFAKLPPGTIEGLLNDKARLAGILTCHVVPGRLTAADVAQRRSLLTAQGQTIAVQSNGGVQVDNARVIQADIAADNGVIHAIDSVILPK